MEGLRLLLLLLPLPRAESRVRRSLLRLLDRRLRSLDRLRDRDRDRDRPIIKSTETGKIACGRHRSVHGEPARSAAMFIVASGRSS